MSAKPNSLLCIIRNNHNASVLVDIAVANASFAQPVTIWLTGNGVSLLTTAEVRTLELLRLSSNIEIWIDEPSAQGIPTNDYGIAYNVLSLADIQCQQHSFEQVLTDG